MRSLAMITALSLATLAPLAGGCATHDASTEMGTVQLPLVKTTPDGTVFQLSAEFEITGPGGTQILDGRFFEPALNVELPPGLTRVRLLDGWTLTRTLPNTTNPEPVSALLGTDNPFILRVLANQSSQVQFGFIVRNTTGNVQIDFGIATDPRELAGGLSVTEATGEFTPYLASPAAARLDFAFYLVLNRFDSVILPDGTKDRVYGAGFDEFQPTPLAAEFFNDAVGPLANVVGPALGGGFLEYHIAAKPDGTRELTGTFTSGFNPPFVALDFGPYTLEVDVPLDPDGFPADVFFHDDSVPFTLTAFLETGDSTLRGFLNLRHIP